MDVVKFLNDVTGGHLLAWKVVATTVVFALAGLQLFLAARFWQVATFPGPSPVVAACGCRKRVRVFGTVLDVAVKACGGGAGASKLTRS